MILPNIFFGGFFITVWTRTSRPLQPLFYTSVTEKMSTTQGRNSKRINNKYIFVYTVSLYKLEDKQKPHTKLSMYPINIHIGKPKTAFTKILAAYGFLKIEFKVLKQL